MFTLVMGGRKIKKDVLTQYKNALERYNLNPETGYLP